MNSNQRLLLYFVLPTLAPLIFPPDWIIGLVAPNGQISLGGIFGLLLAIVLFVFLGFMLMRGRSAALNLTIFLQGLNVIVRLMMLSHAFISRVFSTPGMYWPRF